MININPYLFTLVMDEFIKSISDEVPWCMIFANDVVLVDKTNHGVNINSEIWRCFRIKSLWAKKGENIVYGM